MYCFFFHNFRAGDFYHYELMFIIRIFVTILFWSEQVVARPRRKRCISGMPVMEGYKPFGIPMRELSSVILLHEELESLRLCDYLGMKQEDAAEMMRVSRPTFTRIYEKARKTVATAFAEGKAILIDGGDFQLEEQINPLNSYKMKIALPTKSNIIDDHFGHCESFTVFTINDNDEIESKEIIPSANGCGCKSGIASVLKQKGVEIMLAGNMGEGAKNVLENHDIAVYRGCRGDATEVTRAFLRGELNDSGESCAHHHSGGDHGHDHGHQCQH